MSARLDRRHAATPTPRLPVPAGPVPAALVPDRTRPAQWRRAQVGFEHAPGLDPCVDRRLEAAQDPKAFGLRLVQGQVGGLQKPFGLTATQAHDEVGLARRLKQAFSRLLQKRSRPRLAQPILDFLAAVQVQATITARSSPRCRLRGREWCPAPELGSACYEDQDYFFFVLTLMLSITVLPSAGPLKENPATPVADLKCSFWYWLVGMSL